MGKTDHLEQPLSFAKYQLVARLADGRMGTVYKAKSHGVEGFEKIHCIKVIDPELADNQPGFIEALIEEAKRAVSLSHANVAQVHDLGHEDDSGKFYLATEYINGFDLGRALQVASQTGRDWPRDLSLYVASEAAKAVDYAHRRKDFNFNNLNLLHRDIHPSNILISFDGEVKLTDFGISRAMETVPVDFEPDPARRFLYAPPEHVRDQTYTRKSDIFSLGLVLYEMLVGTHPYRNAKRPVRAAAQAAQIPPIGDVIDVPQPIQQVIDSMLAPDPAGRADSAGTIYEELVGYLFGNNLRADDRALSLLIEELRQAESEGNAQADPNDEATEEISRSDVEDFYDRSSASLQPPVDRIREIQEAREEQRSEPDNREPSDNDQEPSEPLPDLPGGLERCFEAARKGDGRAVLMSGHFGRGPEYLPDRISEVLEWRGNARAMAVHATRDDVYRPLGVLTDAIVAFLTGASPDDYEARFDALEQLEEMGAPEAGLDLLRSLWDRVEAPRVADDERRALCTELFVTMLRETSRERPVVLVVDRVERCDDLTIDVLRRTVGAIDELSAMIVLATSADEMMRATFDVGNPEALRAIRVSAPQEGELGAIPELSRDASEVLLSLALSEQPLDHRALAEILEFDVARVAEAAEELTESDLVRTPDSQTLLTGIAEASVWVKQRFSDEAIKRNARALCRHYSSISDALDGELLGPTLVRLYATAEERRRTLNLADRFSDWLERNGWLDVALDFYEYCSDLLAQESIGSPQARIGFLLARAGLALDLSRLDQTRNSLEPLRALSETVRNEQGFVRSQVLFGRLALREDDVEESYACLTRATRVARGLREPQLLGVCHLALAGWSDRYGDLVSAQDHLEGALNLANRWGTFRMNLDRRSALLLAAVRLYLQRDMPRRADDLLDDLDALAEAETTAAVACRAVLGDVYALAARDDFDTALEQLDRALDTARSTGRTALVLDVMRRDLAVSLDGERYDRLLARADDLVDRADRHDELYTEERARDLRAVAAAARGSGARRALERLRQTLERAQSRAIPRDRYRAHHYLALALENDDPDAAAEHRRAAEQLRRRMQSSAPAA